jgi:hypothetical protein
MNNIEYFSGHCRTQDFGAKEDQLHASGYKVIIADFFKNSVGEDFVKFVYYPKGLVNQPISPIKKSPSIERIAKENLISLELFPNK